MSGVVSASQFAAQIEEHNARVREAESARIARVHENRCANFERQFREAQKDALKSTKENDSGCITMDDNAGWMCQRAFRESLAQCEFANSLVKSGYSVRAHGGKLTETEQYYQVCWK
jgi:hypothetical protein